MLLLYNLLNLANKSCLRSISKCITVDTRIYYEFLMHDCPFLKYMLKKKQSGGKHLGCFYAMYIFTHLVPSTAL